MIKILIVDDSKVEAELIKHMLASEPNISIVGYAKDGAEAIEMTARLSPDLITMDLEMPIMDGHSATRIIMSQFPTPIVVISSKLSETSKNMTYLALEAGAVSVLAKPVNMRLKENFEKFRKQLIDTVHSMAEIKVIKRRFATPVSNEQKFYSPTVIHQPGDFEIVAIGTSVGGPQILKSIFAELSDSFPVPIVVVQHMTHGFMTGFTHWLNLSCHLTVKNVEHNEILENGVIYFAPDYLHFTVERTRKGLVAKLIQADPVAGFCPSITVLLQSIAKICQKKAIGILLTGMGRDGAEGLLALKKAGGHTLIQDPKSCVVFGMGKIAESMGAVDKVIEIHQMAKYIIKMTRST